MAYPFFHQLIISISFGLTTAVITTLGIIVGLEVATSSKLSVIAGILLVAIADGLSDAVALHLAEESEIEIGKAKHTPQEIWLTTILTFLFVAGFSSSFVFPLLFFPFKTATLVAILWGIFLVIILNFWIAKIKKERPAKLILEHLLLIGFIILISNFLGNLISRYSKF